eukprot:3075856-Lingulodinium_polyedra.AAC.1
MLREAIENWVSLRVMALQGCEVTLDPTTLSLPPPAVVPQPGNGTPRTVALLSLFDGTGMVRVGMEDLLRLVDARAALVASGFSELNRTLAHA